MKKKFTILWRKTIDFIKDLLVLLKAVEWLTKLLKIYQLARVILLNRHLWIGLYWLLIMNIHPATTPNQLSAYQKAQPFIRIAS